MEVRGGEKRGVTHVLLSESHVSNEHEKYASPSPEPAPAHGELGPGVSPQGGCV